MWKPWHIGTSSNERAVANARAAAIDLSRLRVERAEIELYVARLGRERTRADQPA